MEKKVMQEQEWQVLHDRITEVLNKYGRKDAFGKGDYWLLDDNWGRHQQQLEIQNLNLLKPHIVKSLQALLANFPNWYITAQVDLSSRGGSWPGMGVLIYPDEIVDELLREFLPEEFRSYSYVEK
jgi:hypothetical protein